MFLRPLRWNALLTSEQNQTLRSLAHFAAAAMSQDTARSKGRRQREHFSLYPLAQLEKWEEVLSSEANLQVSEDSERWTLTVVMVGLTLPPSTAVAWSEGEDSGSSHISQTFCQHFPAWCLCCSPSWAHRCCQHSCVCQWMGAELGDRATAAEIWFNLWSDKLTSLINLKEREDGDLDITEG